MTNHDTWHSRSFRLQGGTCPVKIFIPQGAFFCSEVNLRRKNEIVTQTCRGEFYLLCHVCLFAVQSVIFVLVQVFQPTYNLVLGLPCKK